MTFKSQIKLFYNSTEQILMTNADADKFKQNVLYTVIHLNFKLDIILNIWSVWSRCQIIEGYFQIDKYRAAFIVLPRGREGCSEGGREDCEGEGVWKR